MSKWFSGQPSGASSTYSTSSTSVCGRKLNNRTASGLVKQAHEDDGISPTSSPDESAESKAESQTLALESALQRGQDGPTLHRDRKTFASDIEWSLGTDSPPGTVSRTTMSSADQPSGSQPRSSMSRDHVKNFHEIARALRDAMGTEMTNPERVGDGRAMFEKAMRLEEQQLRDKKVRSSWCHAYRIRETNESHVRL
jgi:hypothetical protein